MRNKIMGEWQLGIVPSRQGSMTALLESTSRRAFPSSHSFGKIRPPWESGWMMVDQPQDHPCKPSPPLLLSFDQP